MHHISGTAGRPHSRGKISSTCWFSFLVLFVSIRPECHYSELYIPMPRRLWG